MNKEKIRRLFPGSNTSAGFMGFFEDLRQRAKRTIIFKGGPGVGKSTLMREAGKRWEEAGERVEYYHCSGDPDSLDAVFAPEAGLLAMDGTAPHIVDPRLPGAADGILNLGVCLNEKQLAAQRDALEKLSGEISAAFARAYCYLTAAKAVRQDAAAVYDAAFGKKERRALEQELLSMMPSLPEGGGGHAFAQAITCQGVLQQLDSMMEENVCCLDVPWGFDVHALLLPLWNDAARKRAQRFAYHDPLDATCLAHVAVGDWLFTTAVMMDAPCLTPQLDAAILRREGPRLAFDRAVYDLTLNQAVEALAEAKARHDELERYYIDAMDYSRLGAIKQEFLEEIRND